MGSRLRGNDDFGSFDTSATLSAGFAQDKF